MPRAWRERVPGFLNFENSKKDVPNEGCPFLYNLVFMFLFVGRLFSPQSFERKCQRGLAVSTLIKVFKYNEMDFLCQFSRCWWPLLLTDQQGNTLYIKLRYYTARKYEYLLGIED